MAIKHPRMAVTIPEEYKRLYERGGEVFGTSASKFIASILIDMSPAVEELIDAVESRSLSPGSLIEITSYLRDVHTDEDQEDLLEYLERSKGKKSGSLLDT